MPATPAERRLAAQIAANEGWGACPDRSARTAPGRAAAEQRFLDLAGGDPAKAAALRRAHFQRLALASVRARRLAKEAAATAERADAELAAAEADQ